MRFKNYGPVDISKSYVGVLQSPFEQFWKKVEEEEDGLSQANGCYIFGVRSSGGPPQPWYVGQAQKSFKQECFQPHKLNHYNVALKNYQSRGVPILLFIARRTPAGQSFAKPSKNPVPAIDELEGMLIAKAMSKNPNLRNVRGTSFWANAVVPGLLNSPTGNQGKATQVFKSMLGL